MNIEQLDTDTRTFTEGYLKVVGTTPDGHTIYQMDEYMPKHVDAVNDKINLHILSGKGTLIVFLSDPSEPLDFKEYDLRSGVVINDIDFTKYAHLAYAAEPVRFIRVPKTKSPKDSKPSGT